VSNGDSNERWALPGTVRRKHDGTVVIAAGKCTQCGKTLFPKPSICPECLGKIEPADVEGPGKLYTYSVVHAVRPGWPSPYAIAYVDFPGDVRICGPLDLSGRQVPLDTLVSIEVGPLRTDDAGLAWSHRFVPIETTGSQEGAR